MSNVVIIGAGQAGGQLAIELRQLGFAGSISIVGAEETLPYQRPPLSKAYLMREIDEARLQIRDAAYYNDARVDLYLGHSAVEIDPVRRRVLTSKSQWLDYQTLVFATGARPRKAVWQDGRKGIYTLRDLTDANALRDVLESVRRIGIVGGGYVGLEVAAAARKFGVEVVLFEAAQRVLNRVASPAVAQCFIHRHECNGVQIRVNSQISGLTGVGSVTGVELADGTHEPVDAVVVGIGVEPNVELAESIGVELNNGIVVDAEGRTNLPGVFAIGDATTRYIPRLDAYTRFESVPSALEQAQAVARNVTGHAPIPAAAPWFWSEQYDLKLQLAGVSQGYTHTVIRGDLLNGSGTEFYLVDDLLVAAGCVNKPAEFTQVRRALGHGPLRVSAEALGDAGISLAEVFKAAVADRGLS